VREVDVAVSIDTYKAEVARAALAAGAHLVNDVHGFRREPEVAAVAAEFGVPAVAMHNQRDREFHDVIGDITVGLVDSLRIARERGLPDDRVIIDPGFNFGWTEEQALEMLRRLGELRALGRPLLVGTSRKSTIGVVLGLPVEERLEGTAATVALAIASGADIVRVHDVIGDITVGLVDSLRIARERGLPDGRVIVDPGFNFGWTEEQALEMLRRLGELRALGRPLLVGTSRKSTIGVVLGLPVEERLEGTAATVALAIANGADIVRVHDVKEMARVARMADAVVRGWTESEART